MSVERSALNVERSGEAAARSASVDADNPWPGLASFTEDSRAFFFGREKETDELVRLIRRNTLTVLFGQSGLGKSSLLQAGAFPFLRDTDYLPLYLRLDHAPDSPPLAEQVKSALTAAFASAGADAPGFRADETLWEYFHRKDTDIWSAKNRLLTPVLAFDQFEEIFTLGRASEAQRERGQSFLIELADLVENRAPAALREKFDSGELDIARYNFAKPSCQVVLSLREDFLPDLEGLKNEMRSIMQSRMRVKRLNGTQALEIVQKPAPHLLAEGVAERVVEFVAGARGGSTERLAELEVEPALLSVICRELNERRRTLGQAQITTDLVSGNRREILTDFYERSVADLPEAMRTFVEDRLLTKSGFRDNLALETALESPGVTRLLIDSLVGRRLVRIEDRIGVQRVELTHDVLAEVIRASRDERHQRRAHDESVQRERAAREAVQAQLEETRATEQATRHALWRARVIATGCAFLALAAVGSAIFGYLSLRRARAANAQARAAETKALAAADGARRAEERAVEVRRLAEKSRGEAEKLVSFLLDDFYDELAPTGRLSTVGRLAKQAADYYEALPPELRSTATERSRAIALARYGASLVSQGNAGGEDRATPVLRNALELLEKLRAAGDKNEATLIGLLIAQTSLAEGLSASNDAGGFSGMKALLETLRPKLAQPDTSRRFKQVYGEALSFFGFLQDKSYASTEDADSTLAEARQLFIELGAKPLTNLDAASAYAEATFRTSHLTQSQKRRGQQRGGARPTRRESVREARVTAEAVLAKRPADLRALRTRAEAVFDGLNDETTLQERNAESFTDARLEVLEEAEACWAEYLRYDPSNAEAWGSLGRIRERTANQLIARGRVREGAEKIESTLALEREMAVTPALARFVQGWWGTAAEIAALQGNRARTEICLQNMQRMVELRIRQFRPDSTSRVGPQESYHTAVRTVQSRLGDFEAMYRAAQEALVRSESYHPNTDLGRSGKRARANVALRDLAIAALATGRFEEAERARRKIVEDRENDNPWAGANDRAWLALAIFRQGRIEEARQTFQPVADRLAERPRSIDSNLFVRFDYLNALYVRVVLQPADATGAAQRRALLAEGIALCEAQSDEVKAFQWYKSIRARLDQALAESAP